MADNPFDRTPLYPLEKPLADDINQGYSQEDMSIREVLRYQAQRRIAPTLVSALNRSGFTGTSMWVRPSSPASFDLSVTAGIGFQYVPSDTPAAIGGVLGLDDLSSYKPIVLNNAATLTVPAPPGANARIDIIEVRYDRLLGNPQSRQLLNTTTGAFAPSSLNKTLAFSIDSSVGYVVSPADSTAALSYKQGIVAASPVAPTVTTGYVKIAEVHVDSTTVSVSDSNLVDSRPLILPGGVTPVAASWRLQWNGGTPIVTTLMSNAPPGIRIGLYCLAKGEAYIYTVGGQITAGTQVVNLVTYGVPAANEIVALSQSGSSDVTSVIAVTTAVQTRMAACTPTIAVGVDATALLTYVRSRYQSAGTTNNTNVLLEDLVISISGVITY